VARLVQEVNQVNSSSLKSEPFVIKSEEDDVAEFNEEVLKLPHLPYKHWLERSIHENLRSFRVIYKWKKRDGIREFVTNFTTY
jgi:hypothetical protein